MFVVAAHTHHSRPAGGRGLAHQTGAASRTAQPQPVEDMKREQRPALFHQVSASRLKLPTSSLRMVLGRTVEFLSVAVL